MRECSKGIEVVAYMELSHIETLQFINVPEDKTDHLTRELQIYHEEFH